jgi:hypothetical protein
LRTPDFIFAAGFDVGAPVTFGGADALGSVAAFLSAFTDFLERPLAIVEPLPGFVSIWRASSDVAGAGSR